MRPVPCPNPLTENLQIASEIRQMEEAVEAGMKVKTKQKSLQRVVIPFREAAVGQDQRACG